MVIRCLLTVLVAGLFVAADYGTASAGDSQVLSLSAIRNNGQTPIQGAEFPPSEWKLQRLSDHAAVYTCTDREGCGFNVIYTQFPDSSGRSPRECERGAKVSVSQHSIIIPFECTADVM